MQCSLLSKPTLYCQSQHSLLSKPVLFTVKRSALYCQSQHYLPSKPVLFTVKASALLFTSALYCQRQHSLRSKPVFFTVKASAFYCQSQHSLPTKPALFTVQASTLSVKASAVTLGPQGIKAACIVDLDLSLRGAAMPIPAVGVHESMYSELGQSQAGASCLHILSQNGVHEATKVDIVVVVEKEKKHAVLLSTVCDTFTENICPI